MVKWLSGRLAQQASTVALMIGMLASPSLAKDPFRTSNPRPISDRTEAAFRAIFEKGNYTEAQKLLNQSDQNEPLSFALKGFITYINFQGEADPQRKQALLNDFKTYATQTRTVAERLSKTDPLRGNLYQAAGTILEGGYIAATQGTVRGIPQILGNLQQAFRYLDAAERIDPKDPEVNLIKGLIDLTLSTNLNLPLSSPTEAIARLEQNAQPRYVADRGLALGYRDLKQFDRALQAVDRALSKAPDNPELSYLKAQILVRSQRHSDSIPLFQKALSKKDQLPVATVQQIQRELRGAQQRTSGR
ncbi:Sll0314/Alr1548 family TPR repeat-containing protein [Leptolyngbya sp. FACHB-17]|uniref:Sll0314/Alr1548 family TPR repeat-containing protein n=1 Tax=unclassified Leptolyngbya TaxID=2650499 RepID=UPI001681047B|nr:Sll0314/Alr1548 family TPR repeat-containing protein [Leptolyngbya sp. FACHB-17]MBD2082926.1 tetratricopeptide repeat protein [Leptolyngbya sp. FACHB-17]